MAKTERTVVALPVAEVTVLEDRAEVSRRGSITLQPGLNRLRIEGVSLLAVDRSLRVDVEGAKVVDAALTRRWKEVPPGGLPVDASELKKRHAALEKEVRELADAQGALHRRRELVATARADVQREICERAGSGKAEPQKWKEQLTALRADAEKLDAESLVLNQRRLVNQRELASALGALHVAEQPQQTSECALELTLESTGGTAKVKASYLVPCAVWRPAYRATLGAEAIAVETFGVVWQSTGEAWTEVALSFSTARPTLGTQPPSLSEDVLTSRPKADHEKKVVDVSVREEVIQTTGEGGTRTADELPGVDDGGEARLLVAPGKASIPSDGQPHRVPLSTFNAKATLEWLCIPSLSPRINLVARFTNQAPHVLLAGPVDLVRNGGFTGRGRLDFAAAGETVALAFGSEDGARAVREVLSTVDEARLTGRKTTKYSVSTWLVNASAVPLTVTVEERIPVSEVKDVEVKVNEKDTKPSALSVSEDGIARFSAQVPPNGKKELVFQWELSASSRVAGL
jgi:uncharacterized protein (TIGR02231 family)